MRILVVEDDAIIAMSAETTLTDAGHEVIGPCATLNAALAAAAQHAPDLALVDINLAGGEEGVAIARALLRVHGLRSLFATGQPNIARANKDIAMGVLQKPYSEAGLRDAIPVIAAVFEGGSPPPPSIPHGMELFP